MRKLFATVAFVFLSALAFGQTVTVTGHTITGQNGTSSAGISILWELVNDNGQQCKLSGTGLLSPMSFSVTQAQLAAGISLIPNSSIVCGTTTGASRWRYTIKANGTGTRQCVLNITTTTNLDSTACLNATSTPVTATPTDSVYARIDGTNAGFTGNLTSNGSNFTGLGTIGAVTATISGNETVGGTLGVTGAFTAGSFTNNLSAFAATTSAQLAGVISDETGTGTLVFSTTPTLVTPVLGVATATSINKVAITAPATSATLTIANGKTLTASNSLTLAGTDSTTMTFPSTSATIARTDAANTFTGHQTIEGVTSTGATGTGNLVFATGPALASPQITGAIAAGSGFARGSVATCAIGAGVGAACSNTITWSATLSSSTYTMLCEMDSPNTTAGTGNTGSKTTTTAAVSSINLTAGTALSSGTVRCIAIP